MIKKVLILLGSLVLIFSNLQAQEEPLEPESPEVDSSTYMNLFFSTGLSLGNTHSVHKDFSNWLNNNGIDENISNFSNLKFNLLVGNKKLFGGAEVGVSRTLNKSNFPNKFNLGVGVGKAFSVKKILFLPMLTVGYSSTNVKFTDSIPVELFKFTSHSAALVQSASYLSPSVKILNLFGDKKGFTLGLEIGANWYFYQSAWRWGYNEVNANNTGTGTFIGITADGVPKLATNELFINLYLGFLKK